MEFLVADPLNIFISDDSHPGSDGGTKFGLPKGSDHVSHLSQYQAPRGDTYGQP